HFDAPQRTHDTVDAVSVPLADVNAGTRKRARSLAHRFHVSTRREGRTRSGQDHAAHLAIGINAGAGLGEQLAVTLFSQRVAGVGAVDRELDQGPVFFEQKRGQGFLRKIMVNGNLPLKWAFAKSSINARWGILR